MIKNTFKAILFSSTLLLSSACSDSFFQIESPNQPSQSTYWKTESDALMALAACYDAMQSQNLYDDNIDGWKYGFLSRECSTDNGDLTWGDWMLGGTIAKCASSPTDETFSKYWNANYEVIKRCNILIENIHRIPIEESKIEGYKAEAMALRALMYCNLTSLFRDVPFITKPLTLTEAQSPKTERSQIVSALLDELKLWIPKIPVIGSADKGRLTQEAAYAIMGRIALFNQNWEEAIFAYGKVINKVQLFKSGDGTDYAANFADLFTEKNEKASEILLSVNFKGPGLGEGNCFGICWGEPMGAIEASMNLCDDFYCIDGLPIDKSPLFKGSLEKGAHTKKNPDMLRYENRDPRMKGTLMLPGMQWNGQLYTNNLQATSTCAIRKWFTPENVINEYDGSLDFYVIRYAEVLLSLSEAMIEKGGYPQTEITKHINEVRARVGMPSVETVEGNNLDQESLRKIVRHERRVELAFEDLRFADLYRWNEFENAQKRMQYDKSFYDFGAVLRGNVRGGGQDLVWPIPQKEIDTNSMLEQHKEWK
ncbi:MAG: RagB/SusD family nutrient uptake outer membrane protein [Bacteroidales bacterium]